jgi:hypothetical protein
LSPMLYGRSGKGLAKKLPLSNVVSIPTLSVSMRIDVPTRAKMDRIRRVMGWSCVEMFKDFCDRFENKKILPLMSDAERAAYFASARFC